MTGEQSAGEGIDHLGITVPDIDAASGFLAGALGAQVIRDVIVDGVPVGSPSRPGFLSRFAQMLGARPGASLWAVRILGLGGGPCIELFQYRNVDQQPPAVHSDLGMQHFSVCVDDLELAMQRFIACGGTRLGGPFAMPGTSAGGTWAYMTAPWGTVVELITPVGLRRAYDSDKAQQP